jgi:hypothetical protein
MKGLREIATISVGIVCSPGGVTSFLFISRFSTSQTVHVALTEWRNGTESSYCKGLEILGKNHEEFGKAGVQAKIWARRLPNASQERCRYIITLDVRRLEPGLLAYCHCCMFLGVWKCNAEMRKRFDRSAILIPGSEYWAWTDRQSSRPDERSFSFFEHWPVTVRRSGDDTCKEWDEWGMHKISW